ncbi:DNA recombination protein RmuC [Zhongshania sp.]|uniref:DNA recombination protein RmuC n=1 Tax=Zhongshania sp. TaxID=1971902 RepID=UPI001B62380D|nr:DNA recombination protein RmuC [Zhongshania sp.]MBQ0796344.1 DNA recombination protein RmuC [Zhongshania sp.]
MDTPLLVLVAGIVFVGLCLGAVIATVLSRRSNAIQIRMLEEKMGAQQFAFDEQAAKLADAISQRDGAKGLVVEHAQELAVVKERLLMQNQTLSETQASLASSEQKNRELNDALARQESAYTHLQTSTAEQIALLSDAKKQLTEQFEQLANRIFDEKSQRFQVHSRDALELQLKPFRDQLKEFRGRVDHIYDNENRERGELKEQLKNLQEMNSSISKEAQNLTRALKGDNKAQGNWGEVILERVLEESGLRKGHEYETQVSFTDDSGRRRQPDVIVRLPDDKDIVIDAKVSLIAYERYCSSDDEVERQAFLREHAQSVKAHINGLSTKGYEHIEGLRTLDFVFIFIPVEAAFMAAFEHDPELFRNAYEKNIIVVGPTTLLATLRTVQSIWRYERQNQNAEEIARQAGALHDQFALVVQSLEDVGKHLDRGRDAYEKTLNRMTLGKGNLVSRVSRLEALGAKVKKSLPSSLIDRAEIDGVDFDQSDDN